MDEQDSLTPEIIDSLILELDNNQIDEFIITIKSYIYANLLKLNINPESFSGSLEELPDYDSKYVRIVSKDLEDLKYIFEKTS